jgi:SAM-dependent methyltransferase
MSESSRLRKIVAGMYTVRNWLLDQQVFTSTVLPAIPRPIRWALRKLYFLPSDLIELVLGQRDELVPPKSQIFTGSVDDFRTSGARLVDRLVDFGGLTSESKILDIGCGMGRLAVALTSYLSRNGAYEGMDIVPAGIKWCNENIASTHPNFHFKLADISNTEYNPAGSVKASEYPFPFPSETFDLVVLASVFTHMLPGDMEHYVAEISRVLKSGGHCFATYSLLNGESRLRMESGQSSLRFKHKVGPCSVVDRKVPELAVAYDERYVQDLYAKHGLSTQNNIYYGSWCRRSPSAGQESGASQDLVLATKR